MKLPWPLRRAAAYFLRRDQQQPGATNLPVQTAALPWRCTSGGDLEVLLITSRGSPRWLIPKGWPMPGKSLAEAAAQEAYEEAGIEGRIDPQPIGRFAHVKQHGVLGTIDVTVIVHPLAVHRELPEWPERHERSRRWLSPRQAAAEVASGELAALIESFAAAQSR
jgi:8-oxo-dGTP pyrophosphatase MutT (NUDIX family)